MRVYLAGKIAKHDWRSRLAVVSREDDLGEPVDLAQMNCVGDVSYAGPFFSRCDHGCAHGNSSHGTHACTEWKRGLDVNRTAAFQRCEAGIRRADLVFVWVGADFSTAYGTLVEIGMARALAKRIVIAVDPKAKTDDLWFAFKTADLILTATDPVRAFHDLMKFWQLAV